MSTIFSERLEPIEAPPPPPPRTRREAPAAGHRGVAGPGGGSATVLDPPIEWRGTSKQVCGLWPFAVGANVPVTGVPLGRNLFTGGVVAGDPISFFTRAKLLHNPSAFVLGKPGLGKSSLVRHTCTGLSAYGVNPLIVGDLKGEYVDLVRALGGQVLSIGRDRGHLNVLDPGASRAAARRLWDEAARLDRAADDATKEGNDAEGRALRERGDRVQETARELTADAHARALNLVAALITIVRKDSGLTPREWAVLSAALEVVSADLTTTPVLGDLLRVIRERNPKVAVVAVDRDDPERYRALTEDLEASLVSIVDGGRLGTTFTQQTSIAMTMTRAVVFDVSSIDDTDRDLQAAALLACWSQGFAAVEAAHALADHGLEPRRHFMIVLDELWRALRAGPQMVDLVDGVTRLNRTLGVGQIMISHTMSDLLALPTEAERQKARGFVERAGMVFLGGLPAAEMPQLTSVVPLSNAEQALITEWQDPPAWDASAGREAEPPGRGKFLMKIGTRPGVPFRVDLTPSELAVNDTNQRWVRAELSG